MHYQIAATVVTFTACRSFQMQSVEHLCGTSQKHSLKIKQCVPTHLANANTAFWLAMHRRVVLPTLRRHSSAQLYAAADVRDRPPSSLVDFQPAAKPDAAVCRRDVRRTGNPPHPASRFHESRTAVLPTLR